MDNKEAVEILKKLSLDVLHGSSSIWTKEEEFIEQEQQDMDKARECVKNPSSFVKSLRAEECEYAEFLEKDLGLEHKIAKQMAEEDRIDTAKRVEAKLKQLGLKI